MATALDMATLPAWRNFNIGDIDFTQFHTDGCAITSIIYTAAEQIALQYQQEFEEKEQRLATELAPKITKSRYYYWFLQYILAAAYRDSNPIICTITTLNKPPYPYGERRDINLSSISIFYGVIQFNTYASYRKFMRILLALIYSCNPALKILSSLIIDNMPPEHRQPDIRIALNTAIAACFVPALVQFIECAAGTWYQDLFSIRFSDIFIRTMDPACRPFDYYSKEMRAIYPLNEFVTRPDLPLQYLEQNTQKIRRYAMCALCRIIQLDDTVLDPNQKECPICGPIRDPVADLPVWLAIQAAASDRSATYSIVTVWEILYDCIMPRLM
jgi:hypothetical protein